MAVPWRTFRWPSAPPVLAIFAQDPISFLAPSATTSCWARPPCVRRRTTPPMAREMARSRHGPCPAPPWVRTCAPFLLAWRRKSANWASASPAASASVLRWHGRWRPPARWLQGCWSWTIRSRPWTWTRKPQIVAALRQLFGPSQPYAQQCTIVLCSHRLSAFPQADLVVVLDHGRILEQGTHAELSAGNGLYARIYRAQRLVSTG